MSLTTAFYMFILFLAKVLDNTLNTAKTILVQRNRCLLAGVALGLRLGSARRASRIIAVTGGLDAGRSAPG